ncbi:MAG: HAD family phosphatase [Bacteroidota bacterium]
MSAPSIHTIIFDLGGVLIDWNPRHLYRKIFEKEEEMEHFLHHICTQDWNEQQDAGRSTREAADILIPQFPDYQAQIEAFYGRWEEMLAGPIQGTVDILDALCKDGRYEMLALTNWSAETFPIAQQRYAFLRWFEDILVSGKVKLKKPDPRIYQMLIDRHQLQPEEAVFIDDSARNIKAAQDLGIHGIHFTSPAQLRSALAELGIHLP